VQPAVRQALGRDDVWGVGLTMSVESVDTVNGLNQFMDAYEAWYVTDDGRLVIDDPDVRRRLIQAIDSYTAIYRKGCTPPDSVTWGNGDNNQQFLAQNTVMTVNSTLSIPNVLRATRPDDYYNQAVTLDWPNGVYGQPLYIETAVKSRRGFQGRWQCRQRQGIRALSGRGGLARPLSRLRRRPYAANDAEAASGAVLA
jgi:ABC-type glycerol-3-phosphate transport system substrate-binding protein